MQKKLTLSINEDLIRFAHDFSRNTKQTVSSMVEQYFARLKAKTEASGLSPRTLKMYGIFSEAPIPAKKELREIFHEKSNP
jgi:hypothetical protein